jgi:hypothetical protein
LDLSRMTDQSGIHLSILHVSALPRLKGTVTNYWLKFVHIRFLLATFYTVSEGLPPAPTPLGCDLDGVYVHGD